MRGKEGFGEYLYKNEEWEGNVKITEMMKLGEWWPLMRRVIDGCECLKRWIWGLQSVAQESDQYDAFVYIFSFSVVLQTFYLFF